MPRSRLSLSDLPELCTRQQIADYLGASIDTVDRRIRSGKLKAIRDGGLVRILRDDLQEYIRKSKRWN